MLDARNPDVQAAMVELGMSALDAPTWEEIEDRVSQTGPARKSALRRPVPGWAVALVAAAVALLSVGGTLLLAGSKPEVAEPPTTAAVTTTAPPVSTAAVEALVADYHAAYNAGDADWALSLLSPSFRTVGPANLRFWIEELGERVDARCIQAPTYPGAVICTETYTDPFHGAAGLSLSTQLLYTERNGVLLQSPDPGSRSSYPGCLDNRCPQTYDDFAADFFGWLQTDRPEIATEIGDGGRLRYFATDREALAAALPFAAEFIAQSTQWAGSSSSPIAGMTTGEAVASHYATLNSRDLADYRAFYGEPPPDALLWLWQLGTTWEAQCEPVPGDAALVRCEEQLFDDFYSKAGAVFLYRTLWTVAGDRLMQTTEWEMTSGDWAYTEFESDFGAWLRSAYPDEYPVVFAGTRLGRTPEAAEAAMKRIDEFLEQSPDYPRRPDPENEVSRNTG